MKIDPKELQQLAAAAPRLDLYAGIHKAMRAAMVDTLLALGRMDARDPAQRQATSERVLQLLALCASHLEHENAFVHAAMEARAPGASAAVAHDHVEHVADIARLGQAARELAQGDGEQVGALGLALYRDFSRFVAHNFEHMLVEETAHNAVLWAHYTDAELAALHDALVASIPPQEAVLIFRWMIPALTPAERVMVLGDVQAKAPPPAFQAVLGAVQPHLSAGEWAQLSRALNLVPVPGLAA